MVPVRAPPIPFPMWENAISSVDPPIVEGHICIGALSSRVRRNNRRREPWALRLLSFSLQGPQAAAELSRAERNLRTFSGKPEITREGAEARGGSFGFRYSREKERD